MAKKPRTYAGKPFRMLVGLRPFHRSVEIGQIRTGNVIKNGLMVEGATGIQPLTAQITVADNDFSGGRVELILGEYRLLSGVDYAIGAAVGNTATNLADAISRLTGFAATALGAVVSITYDIGTAHVVDFKANHFGLVTNLILLPTDGEMTLGSPAPGPVDID